EVAVDGLRRPPGKRVVVGVAVAGQLVAFLKRPEQRRSPRGGHLGTDDEEGALRPHPGQQLEEAGDGALQHQRRDLLGNEVAAAPVARRVVPHPVEGGGDRAHPPPRGGGGHRPSPRMPHTSRATLRSTLGPRWRRLIDGWRFSSSWMGIPSTRYPPRQ